MMRRAPALAATVVALAAIAGGVALAPLDAQDAARFGSAGEARAALDTARQQQRNARTRGERLERQAANARQAADKATQQAAALAARIQQAEAAIAGAEARLAIAQDQRRTLDRRLAARREPLAALTGALQSMARRPFTLSALQRGSLRDLVHTRAVLASTVPLIRARTAALRGDLDRARVLEADERVALSDLRDGEAVLRDRRRELVTLAEKERIVTRRASGDAGREAERALVLAEQARDLDGLVDRLEAAGSLRETLAALPGPIPRPADPERATPAPAAAPTPSPRPRPSASDPPARYQLPVTGRIVAGFGEREQAGIRRPGIAMLPPAGAQVVSPGAGRVAFAGPYRGYGRIVIVEHPGGWTSLVTGLASLDTAVGQTVTAGSPLGLAARTDPGITLELRHEATPVNPLDHLR